MRFLFARRSFNKLFSIYTFVFCLTAGACFISLPAYAAPGECGLDFLNITVGAYSISTGHANYAGTEGPEAIFGNPALLGDKLAGFASYQYLLMDTKSQAVSANLPLSGNYRFGFGAHIFDPGAITGYDSEGQKTGGLNSGDYLLRFALSSQGALSYGLSVSYYYQQLDNIVGRGYGFGFGLSHENGIGRISLSADNIGPDFKIGGASMPLPSRIALSGWLPMQSRFISLSGDIIYSRESGFGVAAGLDYSPVTGFSFRAGSNIETPVSLGLGYAYDNIGLDYSYIPSGLFGDRHNFSVTMSR